MKTKNNEQLPRLRAEVQWRRERGAPGYLFSARSGAVFTLNRTAATILEVVQSAGTEAEAIRALVAGFEVEDADAAADIAAFLATLKEQGLVEG